MDSLMQSWRQDPQQLVSLEKHQTGTGWRYKIKGHRGSTQDIKEGLTTLKEGEGRVEADNFKMNRKVQFEFTVEEVLRKDLKVGTRQGETISQY